MSLARHLQSQTINAFHRLIYGRYRRYSQLPREIRKIRAKTLLDIGVFNGENSARMLRAALEGPGDVHYFGFDLFEDMTPDVFVKESSKGKIHRKEEVEKRLSEEFAGRAHIHLIKGSTTQTLGQWLDRIGKVDFAFIDGGHSYETVLSDWTAVQKLLHPGSVVIFDDYVNEAAIQNQGYGTNRVIDAIDRSVFDVQLLSPRDHFEKPWGILRTRLAKVTFKQNSK